MNNQLKLAILAHSYLPVSGGMQTYIHTNAKEIVKQGHEIHVIVPNNGLKLQPFEMIDGVYVHRTSVENIYWCYPVIDNSIGDWTSNKDYAGWGAQLLQFMIDALMIIKEYDIQLIHTHFTATPVGELFSLYHDIPYVDTIYGFYTDYLPSSDMKKAAKTFYNNANLSAIVVISDYVKNACIKNGIPERLIHKVNPSVDLKRFNPDIKWGNYIRSILGVGEKEKMILSPIRLQERKGFKHALKAFPYIRQRYPDAHLVITGGSSANPAGIEKPLNDYKNLVKELNIEDRTHLLLNQITDEDMPALYQASDVVLMPSLKESFGISSLEAQAMKKPVIASDIPAFREAMDDTAIYFEPGNFRELSEKVIQILSSESLYNKIVEKGYKRVTTVYNQQQLANQLLGIYQEVLQKWQEKQI